MSGGLCLKRRQRRFAPLLWPHYSRATEFLNDSRAMSDTQKTQLEIELTRLAKRIEELVATVEHLKEENRALRQRHDTLHGERASLLQKNEQVRARVEGMISRLKTLEHGS